MTKNFQRVVRHMMSDMEQGGKPGSKGNKRWWSRRLTKLYNEAKRRHGGQSLSIYGDVTRLLDYLEDVEPVPEGLDLLQECDNLASRLRSA